MEPRIARFRSNLAACLEPLEEVKDTSQEAFAYIHFKNKCAYATNGHILIKSPLYIHQFADEEIKMFEGKFLSIEKFKQIQELGLGAIEGKMQKRGKTLADFFDKLEKYPDYDSAIPELPNHQIESRFVNMIAIDYRLLNKLAEAFIGCEKQFVFHFFGKSKGIHVISNIDIGETGIIMPMRMNITTPAAIERNQDVCYEYDSILLDLNAPKNNARYN